mmetsp:Transcript_25467/g.47873  ORF Transcript_25467/g.47873 Transcript_25467/m.47873 type:complete len:304 (-) Transcript_25467:571-1482(-)
MGRRTPLQAHLQARLAGARLLQVLQLLLQLLDNAITRVWRCLLHESQTSGREVEHDLLAATWDCPGFHFAVDTLHLLALTSAGVARASEDLKGLAGAVLHSLRSLDLQQGDVAAELLVLLVLGHRSELEGQVVDPRLQGFTLSAHLTDLVLNDLVLNEELAEGAALSRKLERLLHAHAGATVGLDEEHPSLVVEVVHGLHEAAIELADDVSLGHLDIVEGDEGGATAPHASAVHLSGLNAWHGPLHEQHAQAFLAGAWGAGLNDDGEVVRVDAVGDPLLLPVHQEVVAGILGPAGQAGHVAAG